MEIEEFYDADPRRRASEEFEFGRDWHDGSGGRFEVSWVADTGELYTVAEPTAAFHSTFLTGAVRTSGVHSVTAKEVSKMTVTVLCVVATRDEVEEMLGGWETAMGQPDGDRWLTERVSPRSTAP